MVAWHKDLEGGLTQAPARLALSLGDTRKYIFGADLFDALTTVSGADGPARLRFQRLSDKAVDMRFDRPDLASPGFCGLFAYTKGGLPSIAWLQERDERVASRSALMDREAINGAAFGTDSAEVERDPRFSVGKSGLILLIALLERRFPDDAWNLGEMEAPSPQDSGRDIRVKQTRRIGKFLFASIEADNRPWGQLTLAATPYVEEVET